MRTHFLIFALFIASSTSAANVVNYFRDALEIPCDHDDECFHMVYNNFTLCIRNQCTCFDMKGQESLCDVKIVGSTNFIGSKCPCPIKYSICDQSTERCICTDNYKESLNRKKCIPKVVHLNEKCEDNSQCMLFEQNSECDMETKMCVCQRNFTQIDDTCRQGAALGARCRVDAECLERGKNTVCLDHKCICQRGYIARRNQTECLAVAGYGQECSESSQCQQTLGYGGMCALGLCVCDQDHQNVSLGNGTICEKRIVVGDACREHGQCYSSLYHREQIMECIGGHCQCVAGFNEVDGQCVQNSADFAKVVSPLFILICIIVHKIIN